METHNSKNENAEYSKFSNIFWILSATAGSSSYVKNTNRDNIELYFQDKHGAYFKYDFGGLYYLEIIDPVTPTQVAIKNFKYVFIFLYIFHNL